MSSGTFPIRFFPRRILSYRVTSGPVRNVGPVMLSVIPV